MSTFNQAIVIDSTGTATTSSTSASFLTVSAGDYAEVTLGGGVGSIQSGGVSYLNKPSGTVNSAYGILGPGTYDLVASSGTVGCSFAIFSNA